MKGVFFIQVGNYHMPINEDSFVHIVDELSSVWEVYVKEYGPLYKYYYVEDSKVYPDPKLIYFGYFDCNVEHEKTYERVR